MAEQYMNWRISGYWKTANTGLIFPVVEADGIQTRNDYYDKISTDASYRLGTNNNVLSDITGTLWYDCYIYGTTLPPQSPSSVVLYKRIDYAGKTCYIGVRHRELVDGKTDILVEVDDNIDFNTPINRGCIFSLDENVIIVPESYTPLGIIRIPSDGSLAVINLSYNLPGEVGGSRSDTNDKCAWITELSSTPTIPDGTKGAYFQGPVPPQNPYQPGGPSTPDDPNTPGYVPGTFDDSSDAIPDSSLPTLSAANTGFTRIYNPTLSQVQDLARYLWTDETVIQTIWNHIKQYFEDPMQAIIGFNLVPCAVPNSGAQSFALMYIDTGVSMNVASNQFVDVDCGTVKLERYYGSALDQSPYTKVSCYLPFIGTVRLNTDEVIGTTLQVKYRIDICSGSCVAKILIEGNVLYQYSGHCAINIPISSADFSSYVSSAISVARLAIGAGVAGAAGVGAATVSNPEQQTNRTVTVNRTTTTTARNPSTGRQITTGTRTVSETRSFPVKSKEPQDTTQASFNALSPENISNTVGQVMSSKPSIEHSGSFSGNSGYLGVRRPYLIIERPNMCMPDQYQHFNGFPSMITMSLSECKGFTRIHQVQLTGMSATNPEQGEILSLLKSGVYF